MKPSFFTHLLLTLVIALTGFFVLPFISHTLNTGLAFALGALLTGSLIALLNKLPPSKHTSSSASHTPDKKQQNTGPGTTLYVGNLPYRANEQAIREHFATAGTVLSVRLMRDRRTGKRKGYGFIEVDKHHADTIINTFNEQEFQERTLKVRLAKEKTE